VTRPPSGEPPPVAATLADGTELDLVALAAEICRRYRAEYPDEQERYGDAGIAWCRHDNQHILHWAALTTRGAFPFEEQIAWLARVLEARDFPLDRLARDLEIAAETGPPQLAGILGDGARLVRSRPSFRTG